MKRTRKSSCSIISALKQSEIGLLEGQSDINASRMKLVKHGFMTSIQLESLYRKIQMMSQKKLKQNAINQFELYIQESLQLNKSPTYRDNAIYYQQLFQIQKLWKTLDPGLTSIDMALPNWYDEFVMMKSHKLLSLSKTDSADSAMNCLSSSVPFTGQQSWFTVTESLTPQLSEMMNLSSKMTSCPSSMFLLRLTTASERKSLEKREDDLQNKILTQMGILKVRLYPTKVQQKQLRLMFDGNRWAWNLLLEKIGTRLFDKSIKETVLKKEIRPFVQKANISKDLSISVLNEQCFDSAFRDIFKSKKAIWEATKAKKLRDGQGFILPERLKNKTKKDSGNSIEIRSRDFTYFKKQRVIKFFPEYFKFDRKSKQGIKIKTNLRKIGVSIDHSCRLVMTDDLFFLHIPYEKKCVPTQSTATCALDPGFRTFLTGYNPEGETFEISNQNKHIYDRQALINKLQKKLQTESSKRKRKDFRRHITDLYRKVKNCIGDMHHKVSKMLSENFSCIILPEFSTSKMVKKKTNEKWRKINGTTAHRTASTASDRTSLRQSPAPPAISGCRRRRAPASCCRSRWPASCRCRTTCRQPENAAS